MTIVRFNEYESRLNADISVEAAKAALATELPAINSAVAEVYTDSDGNKVIDFKTKAGKLGC